MRKEIKELEQLMRGELGAFCVTKLNVPLYHFVLSMIDHCMPLSIIHQCLSRLDGVYNASSYPIIFWWLYFCSEILW